MQNGYETFGFVAIFYERTGALDTLHFVWYSF